MRQFGYVGRVGVLAAAVLLGGIATSEAETSDAWGRCSVGEDGAPQSVAGLRRRDARTGVVFRAGLDDHNRATLTATSGDFQFEKSVTSTGETHLRIVVGDDNVSVSFSQQLLVVGRGANTASVDPRVLNEDDGNRLRQLLAGSRAVRAFRSLAGVFELRAPEEDDVFATALLVDGALVASLDGDPGAIARIARRSAARRFGRLQAVKARQDRFEDCVGKYENTLSWAWDEMVECNVSASDDPWYLRSINMSMCNAEWLLRAEGAFFQFTGCMALPLLEELP